MQAVKVNSRQLNLIMKRKKKAFYHTGIYKSKNIKWTKIFMDSNKKVY